MRKRDSPEQIAQAVRPAKAGTSVVEDAAERLFAARGYRVLAEPKVSACTCIAA